MLRSTHPWTCASGRTTTGPRGRRKAWAPRASSAWRGQRAGSAQRTARAACPPGPAQGHPTAPLAAGGCTRERAGPVACVQEAGAWRRAGQASCTGGSGPSGGSVGGRGLVAPLAAPCPPCSAAPGKRLSSPHAAQLRVDLAQRGVAGLLRPAARSGRLFQRWTLRRHSLQSAPERLAKQGRVHPVLAVATRSSCGARARGEPWRGPACMPCTVPQWQAGSRPAPAPDPLLTVRFGSSTSEKEEITARGSLGPAGKGGRVACTSGRLPGSRRGSTVKG